MALRPDIEDRKRKKRATGRAPSAASSVSVMNAVGVDTPSKRRRMRPQVSTIVAVLIMAIGLGIIAYPTFSDWWNSYHQSRAIANYVQAVEQSDSETIKSMLNEAHAYNERLLSRDNRYVMTDEEIAEYESILNLGGDGVMGYIQISTIGVNLPIYHGVDESVLQVAIGHIQGSSLPVGGASTHAVVSGHRGLPSAKLFTDLDKLVEGDTFTITILDQTITYLVDQIRIVEPEDMSDLNIVQGEDYVTLITCTPYGINTHRLLVRGHRIENIADLPAISADAVQIPNYIAIPAVAVPMLFIYLVGTLIYLHMRHPEFDRDKVLSEIRKLEGMQETSSEEGGAYDDGVASGEQTVVAPGRHFRPSPAGTDIAGNSGTLTDGVPTDDTSTNTYNTMDEI